MNKKIFIQWHPKILRALYVLTALTVAYYAYHDIKETDSQLVDIDKRIKKAHTVEYFHPFLIGGFHDYMPYTEAIDLINRSPDERYWVTANSIDPTLNLNYFIYPKEARMTVETQFALYSFLMDKIQYPPVDQPPPAQWDKKISIHQKAVITDK